MGALLAVLAAAEQRLIQRLTAKGATSPDSAIALDPLDADERGRCEHLLQTGVLREATPGHFYLDEIALAKGPARLRRLGFFLGGALLVAIVAVIIATIVKAG
jgi:hypothetical protein